MMRGAYAKPREHHESQATRGFEDPHPYGRSTGVVFHDTRHSAVTNLVASGTGEAAAMSISGHTDPTIFKRYNLRRDSVQAEAAERRNAYLAAQRGTTPALPSIATTK